MPRSFFLIRFLAPWAVAAFMAMSVAQAQTGPVILTQQPGTALDISARQLMAGDLARAKARGETPIVLIGSAPLSSRKGDVALFVQVQSASLCGSAGCSTSVYLKHGEHWSKVLDSVSGPVTVMPKSHGGMRDLRIDSHDVWRWQGTAYQDTAPSIGSDEALRRSVEAHQAAVRKDSAQTSGDAGQ
ncbi:hypothetical protein AA103196_0417 [Ameyamaea chiangmaiensis NBRC 103196]|uniref:Uncharacterized protein n=1 Tax=Ameyamaea chiangmaiensis TaxID=442969 RepID=A0A850PGV7_9PROT|nr:hypothetical protein [Ameyamaea chiangmaiensis]MBS4074814.1 hypothetical protein [Ameyamaea chiangmaiensis]NVN41650.1 hypothetical protein [Ameyamaea chiangmaiensis]GBQ62823.1 hypothetical protein AA103196_0417 [Ameyamaea chiangmaiensis NBRC 103196]